MSDEKKPEAIVRRAFVPRRFPGHAFYDDFVKKLEAQFVDAGQVQVPQGEEGVEMSDVMRVGGGTFNVPVMTLATSNALTVMVHHKPRAETLIDWVFRIPPPPELSGPVSCSHVSPPPWRNGSTMNPTDPTTGEVNAESPPTDAVQNHIDLVTDDLIQGRTTPDQRRSLGKAVERADRVAPNTDRAFGRILGG